MKSNNELEKGDIEIDPDIEASDPILITAYVETWFDVDKKFGTNTNGDDERWVNLYAEYNIDDDSLRLTYHIDTPKGVTEHEYTPIGDETQIIKNALFEKIKEIYGQTPQEFCAEAFDEDIKLGGQV